MRRRSDHAPRIATAVLNSAKTVDPIVMPPTMTEGTNAKSGVAMEAAMKFFCNDDFSVEFCRSFCRVCIATVSAACLDQVRNCAVNPI